METLFFLYTIIAKSVNYITKLSSFVSLAILKVILKIYMQNKLIACSYCKLKMGDLDLFIR